MGGQPSRPSLGGWYAIHNVIRNSIDNCIKLCATPPSEATDLSKLKDYNYHVLLLLVEHHKHEDDIYFPLWNKHCPELSETFKALSAEHKALHDLLERLEKLFGPFRKNGVRPPNDTITAADVQTAAPLWVDVKKVLYPHLEAEEKSFTPQLYEKIPTEEASAAHERMMADIKAPADSHIRLVLCFYSLKAGEQRDQMFAKMPWIVKSVLIPRVWHSSYEHLIPLFPCYP